MSLEPMPQYQLGAPPEGAGHAEPHPYFFQVDKV